MSVPGYPTSAGVEAAIKDAAQKACRTDPSRIVPDLIRQACFDRFLCRVFSDDVESDWALKGGTGMLARVPNARATLDIDLYRSARRPGAAAARPGLVQGYDPHTLD